jgi:hypothetical protein
MSIASLHQLRRTANIAYSRHPLAWLRRGWRYFTIESEDEPGKTVGNLLLLPLAMPGLTLLLIATVPVVSDAIAASCDTISLP